jgi:AAA domain
LRIFLRNAEKRGGLRRAVVICGEAGLKSNRQGAELLRLAQKHDLRVLLVGDVRQHVSVEAGDFLRVLETHSQLRRCRVEQIHRQRQAAYRGAVERMAAGDVRGGLAALDRLDWIKESQSNYLEKAAADYLRLTGDGKQLDRCLAVSFTWEENHRFTDAIRSGLKEHSLPSTSRFAGPINRKRTGGGMSRGRWSRSRRPPTGRPSPQESCALRTRRWLWFLLGRK